MDEALSGGITNAGAVLRRGEIVDRPAQPHAPAIHRFLEALPQHGFTTAPKPIGLADGREQLTFVSGDVALLPYPAWSMTEAALTSLGALLRRFHQASSAIALEPDVPWATDLADPRGGTILCHSDTCVENVVFRDGEAYGLIDFDMAAPGRPLWDLAMAARYWCDRPADLKALDRERELDPEWYMSNKMLGGACYVDRYADSLAGIRAKIPYFKELGLTYLHLMPLFDCPESLNDGGYAVTNYRKVSPGLGTIDELRDLAIELRRNGISLALDMVFNHTSNEHDWAKQASAGDLEYSAYYWIFPDRSIPDAFEKTTREVFP